MPDHSEDHLTVSQEFEIPSPLRRKAVIVDKKEWEKIKRMISNSIDPTNWYDRLIGFWFSAVWGFIGLATAMPTPRLMFYVAAGFSGILVVIFLIVDVRERKFSAYSKEQILEYADDAAIEEVESTTGVPTPTYNKKFSQWMVSTDPSSDQGVDCLEIPLGSQLLKSLTFRVKSKSKYWRAGFKLVVPNASGSTSDLLADGSFLFHVCGDENGSYGLHIYHNGSSEPAIHKTIQPGSDGGFVVAVERSEKNFVRCFVNDSLEYNGRLDPELFKKAFLVAWGDGKGYEAVFYDIAYGVG